MSKPGERLGAKLDVDENALDEHPSYGLVSIHRQEGGRLKLFGSSLRGHNTKMCLRVHLAKREHDLSQNWYYEGKQVIEVLLSAEQFAQLITTMNTGPGTPCTLTWVRDVGYIEEAPEEELEVERVQRGFSDKLVEFIDHLKKRQRQIRAITEKKSINKGDRKEINDIMRMVLQEVESNMPFVIDQFNRATSKIVTAAKSEVDSFVTMMVHRTGIKELQEMTAKQLTDGSEE